jgi:hypothetical protein
MEHVLKECTEKLYFAGVSEEHVNIIMTFQLTFITLFIVLYSTFTDDMQYICNKIMISILG